MFSQKETKVQFLDSGTTRDNLVEFDLNLLFICVLHLYVLFFGTVGTQIVLVEVRLRSLKI